MENGQAFILQAMKYLISITFSFLLNNCLFAQSTEVTPCNCAVAGSIKLTEEANNDEIYGTAIVAFDIDTTCLYYNARVIQSVSPAKDKIALAATVDLMNKMNKCKRICGTRKCTLSTFKQPITFTKQD